MVQVHPGPLLKPPRQRGFLLVSANGGIVRAPVMVNTAASRSDGSWKTVLEKPTASVEVVRSDQGRPEQYRVILPKTDDAGWRMARIEAADERRELIHPDNSSARGIHLSVVTLAPGFRDRPHWHAMGEKVMFVTEGHGVIASGVDLTTEHEVGPGDAVYVPPFAVHAPRNDDDEPFIFVMVANAPMDITVPG